MYEFTCLDYTHLSSSGGMSANEGLSAACDMLDAGLECKVKEGA